MGQASGFLLAGIFWNIAEYPEKNRNNYRKIGARRFPAELFPE